MSTNNFSRFVVVTTQRSGSTWVIDVLSRLDDTKAYGELFLNQRRTWDAGSLDFPRFCEADRYGTLLRPKRVFAYLDDLYSKPRAVGFKLMYSHIVHYPEILMYLFLNRKKLRILHLIRQNYLNVIVSREMVRARGQAHMLSVADEQDEPDVVRVYLDPKTLIRRIRRAEWKVKIFRRILIALKLDYMEIGYEDLLGDPARFDDIRSFLGLETQTSLPKSGLRKITSSSHTETIQNFETVRRCLASAGYEHLIR